MEWALVAFVVRLARRATGHRWRGRLLPQKIVVEYRARDRRRGRRTESAVLDQNRDRDLRMIGGCVGNVPSVITKTLVDVSGVLLPFERINLRGPRLARRNVLSADEYRRTGSLSGNAGERSLDDLQMLRLDVEHSRRLQRNLPDGAIPHVLDALDEVRSKRHAVVGDNRDGLRLLNRREGVIPLADACGNRIPQIPFVVEALALPRARRQDAEELALDIDARLVPEAELRQERVGVVDVRVTGEHVVIRVAGNDDRLIHV